MANIVKLTSPEGLGNATANDVREGVTFTSENGIRLVGVAKSGEVIVALTENGNTLKRLFWEGNKPRLHAENKNYPNDKKDIYPKELTIQGIALKVIRDIH